MRLRYTGKKELIVLSMPWLQGKYYRFSKDSGMECEVEEPDAKRILEESPQAFVEVGPNENMTKMEIADYIKKNFGKKVSWSRTSKEELLALVAVLEGERNDRN